MTPTTHFHPKDVKANEESPKGNVSDLDITSEPRPIGENVWAVIDHNLLRLRLTDLAQEMHGRIKVDEKRIRFQNLGNLNRNAAVSLVLQMKQDLADEWARKAYEIYCDVWQKQGYVKSAAFLRAVYSRGILPILETRAGAIAEEFARFATATALSKDTQEAHLRSLRLNMGRMVDRWRRRVEIGAKECEHAERTAGQSPAARVILIGRFVEPTQQPAGAEPGRSIDVSSTSSNKKKPGRRPKLPDDFAACAAALWRKAISESGGNVSLCQLRQIASALDANQHFPPARYLEGKYAREVKDFNSRNSNSKIGPVKTWSRLVSLGDKEHLRGMRRLLSRCHKKSDDAHLLSGN